jgi:transposase InsO family protein
MASHGPVRPAREPVRRYEWPCPGDLLHADWTLYARFQRPGHALTGDRSSTAAAKKARVGYDFAHAIVDDHSRLGYAELLPDAKAATVTTFTARALRFFAAHGILARRLMTDNHWSYTLNRSPRELLHAHGIKHLRTPKRRPQPNGKVERFHQTMAREWAYGVRYRSSRHQAEALPHWLRYYNQRRPHSSLGALPPISRVHNLCGQDN